MQDEVEPGAAPESTPESPSQNPKSLRGRRVYKWARWTTIERELRREKGPLLAGVDEVGRGPIAGPVIACAVIMPADTRAIVGVDDSKRLTHDQRVRLAAKIRDPRDLLMTRLGRRYPQYIWDHNAGYTTRAHVAGLASYGITPHHRKSFCRISDLLLELDHLSEIEEREQRALDDVAVPDEDELDDDMIADAHLDIDDLEESLNRDL